MAKIQSVFFSGHGVLLLPIISIIIIKSNKGLIYETHNATRKAVRPAVLLKRLLTIVVRVVMFIRKIIGNRPTDRNGNEEMGNLLRDELTGVRGYHPFTAKCFFEKLH